MYIHAYIHAHIHAMHYDTDTYMSMHCMQRACIKKITKTSYACMSSVVT